MMNTILNDNGFTFKDFEQKTFENICMIGRERTRQFLEGYDVELMKTRDTKVYRYKHKRKTSIKTVYGEVEYERIIYKVVRELVTLC